MIATIKIGPVTYRVVERPRLTSGNGDGTSSWVNGNILYQENELRVEQDMSETMKVAAIWHESCHGILQQAGHVDQPEPLIIALGYGLVSLVRDNPELIKLTRGLTDA